MQRDTTSVAPGSVELTNTTWFFAPIRYILGAIVSTNMFEDVRFSCVIIFDSPSSSITVILNVA